MNASDVAHRLCAGTEHDEAVRERPAGASFQRRQERGPGGRAKPLTRPNAASVLGARATNSPRVTIRLPHPDRRTGELQAFTKRSPPFCRARSSGWTPHCPGTSALLSSSAGPTRGAGDAATSRTGRAGARVGGAASTRRRHRTASRRHYGTQGAELRLLSCRQRPPHARDGPAGRSASGQVLPYASRAAKAS